MNDRISTEVLANGAIRYAEYNAQGGLVGYRYMLPADEPSEVGTPISKATLLKDMTAALFDFPSSAVPDDVFVFLGKFNEHWWRRRNESASIKKTGITSNVLILRGMPSASTTIQYSENATINESNVLELDNPQSMTISLSTGTVYEDLVNIAPCYIKLSNGNIYYLPVGTTGGLDTSKTISRGYEGNNIYYLNMNASASPASLHCTVHVGASEWEYLQSTDENAYPHSGTSGGYVYEYLDVPFDKLPTTPRIETGSYVGTGTYGSSNPNNITFPFVPKFFIVYMQHNEGDQDFPIYFCRSPLIPYQALTSRYLYGATLNSMSDVKWENDGKKISWFSTSAAYQLNQPGTQYFYLAIG